MQIRAILIILLALVGIFLHPLPSGVLDFIFRFLIFASITYIVYRYLGISTPAISNINDKTYVQEKSPFDIEHDDDHAITFFSLINEDNFIKDYVRNEFEILADILVPDNGWIFYKNTGKDFEVINYKFFSSGDPDFTPPSSFESIGIMQILDSRDKVLIENDLSSALHSVAFYPDRDYSPSSFLGIPVQISAGEKLIITFDSATSNHFNQQDSGLIEKFIVNLRSVVQSRLKNININSEFLLNRSLLNFAVDINRSKNVSQAINRLTTCITDSFQADRLTISVLKQDSRQAIIKKVVGQTDIYPESTEFNIDEGLTGWVIAKNKPYLIEDLEKGEYFIPRYSKEEKSNYGLRSFLGVPLNTTDRVYGALTLEHHRVNQYSENDKRTVVKFCKIFSSIFERYINQ